jgi:hypothetical protein
MFEGKPPRTGDARPLSEEGEAGGFLRELTWADLVARLRVSRCRSDAFDSSEEAGDASFDATCARRIAAHHNGKASVNLDNSSYGKVTQRTAPIEMKSPGSGFAPDAARK